jgi:hypothetical protein
MGLRPEKSECLGNAEVMRIAAIDSDQDLVRDHCESHGIDDRKERW